MSSRVLITGAAGIVGSALWPRLTDTFDLRLLDLRAVADVPAGVDVLVGDINDPDLLADAVCDVSAVIHLAAVPDPAASWTQLVDPNLNGVRSVMAAASAAGTPKVVFASSCHASGLYDVDRVSNVDPSWPARPCCPYGVSKVYGETVGRYFAERTDLRVVNLRIGLAWTRPLGALGLQVWLSPDDMAALFTAAVRADIRYGTYFAASANTRLTWDLTPGMRDLGFFPKDNAEDLAHETDLSIEGPECYRGAV